MSLVRAQQVAGFTGPSIYHAVAPHVLREPGWTSRPPRVMACQSPQSSPSNVKRKRSHITLPYSKKRDPRYIPRPLNSFMLFRRDFVANRPEGYISPENKTLSKQAGEAWRLLPASDKKKWAKKAHDVSAEHARQNPTWKYRPRRKYQQQHPKDEQLPISPAAANPSPPVVLQDNIPLATLIRRKESFRLNNWDDSVLSLTPRATVSTNDQQLYELPDSLRRRSSSVPIPEAWNSNLEASSFSNQEYSLPSRPPSSNIGHRLSYSGFRPGFMPLDIFEQPPPHERQRGLCGEPVLQPVPVRQDEPIPSFEGYQITYIPTTHAPVQTVNPPSVSPRHSINSPYVPPFSEMPADAGAAPLTDIGSWDENVNGGIMAPTPFNEFAQPSFPLHPNVNADVSTSATSSERAPSLPLTPPHAQAPDYLVQCMRSINFGAWQSQTQSSHPGLLADCVDSKPLTYPTELFPAGVPISEFFPQDVQGLQLAGLEGFAGMNTVVSPQDTERERCFSLGLGLDFNFHFELDMLHDCVETPLRGGTSSCGSDPESSPPHRQ